jgi:hypothetical protein
MMAETCAPIALFVYKRPEHANRTIEALARNSLAERSELVIFSDGPKTPADIAKVEEVRAMAAGVKGFATVQLVAAQANQGLARSIIGGVTRLTEERGRVIVVEDDLETSPHFLGYMNDALERYADQPRVAAVSGYHPPMDVALPETFFQRDAECWGWATWQRSWSKFETDGAKLLSALKQRDLLYYFDQNGTYPYADMLRGQIAGANDSWAVRWRAHVILNDLLSLYPGRSLTRNIGNDGSGTHSGAAETATDTVSEIPVTVAEIPLVHCEQAFAGFRRYNSTITNNSLIGKLARSLRRLRL